MDENFKALIDFAIREEEEARALYLRATLLTSDLMARKLLNDLSAFEGEHVQTLKDLAIENGDGSPLLVGRPSVLLTMTCPDARAILRPCPKLSPSPSAQKKNPGTSMPP